MMRLGLFLTTRVRFLLHTTCSNLDPSTTMLGTVQCTIKKRCLIDSATFLGLLRVQQFRACGGFQPRRDTSGRIRERDSHGHHVLEAVGHL